MSFDGLKSLIMHRLQTTFSGKSVSCRYVFFRITFPEKHGDTCRRKFFSLNLSGVQMFSFCNVLKKNFWQTCIVLQVRFFSLSPLLDHAHPHPQAPVALASHSLTFTPALTLTHTLMFMLPGPDTSYKLQMCHASKSCRRLVRHFGTADKLAMLLSELW